MPGSGKTTYLKRLLPEGTVDCYFDDYQKGAPEEDKSNPRMSPNYLNLQKVMMAGRNVAVADIRYCFPDEEMLVVDMVRTDFPVAAIVLTYFANDVEACRHNVRLRAREGYVEKELNNIDIITLQYHPPQNRTLPVIMG